MGTPIRKELVSSRPLEPEFLMFLKVRWHECRAFQYDKQAGRMSDTIYVLQLIVIVRHSYAHCFDMQEIVKSALLSHFAQYARLYILPFLYTT